MKRITLLIFLVMLSAAIYGQSPGSLWYFGGNVGLKFEENGVVPLNFEGLDTFGVGAVVADEQKELLFYVNGYNIMGRNYQMMPNGEIDEFNDDDIYIYYPIVIQKPAAPNMFYVFYLKGNVGPFDLMYAEVDMSLNNGFGDVISKDVPVIQGCGMHLEVASHSNGTDFWLLTHGFGDNAFNAFAVTASGINTSPVTTIAGDMFITSFEGAMRVSASNDLLVMGNALTIHVAGFDNSTGQITHHESYLTDDWVDFCEISPSGQYLYVSDSFFGRLMQYNLWAADVLNSGVMIHEGNPIGIQGDLRRGIDGKIYHQNYDNLSVIQDPDEPGLGCNFMEDAISLDNIGLLPFSLDAKKLVPAIAINNFCHGDVTDFRIVHADNNVVITNWDFGDGQIAMVQQPEHIYSSPGTYTVTAAINDNGVAKTLEKRITISASPVAYPLTDIYTCDSGGTGTSLFMLALKNEEVLGDQDPLDAEVSYHATFLDAESGSNALPEEYENTENPQVIYARVQNDEGCYSFTSFMLFVKPEPVVDMPEEYFICKGKSITIQAPSGFDEYRWSPSGSTTQSISIDKAGTYGIFVTMLYGDVTCTGSKIFVVKELDGPEIKEVEINDLAESNTIAVHTVKQGNLEYSLDGINYQDNNYFDKLPPGIYTVYVRDKDGCGTDSEEVILLGCPKFFTPNGDGKNDIWQINYAYFEPDLQINIFDRYGKLITSFKGTDGGWDGTLSGENLHASDYWFVAERGNGKVHKGHFSLLR